MDERAASYAARHFRWNYTVLLLDACVFFFGICFFDSTTVLPVILSRLGAADWEIGLARFVQVLGFTLPALLAAHYIHGRARHKPFLLATCLAGRAGLLTLPVIFLTFGASNPGFVLIWLLVTYGAFSLLDGGSAISWFDVVGKSIPARVRGRFFGAMQTITGVLGMGAGLLVARIMGPRGIPFPGNFAMLALLLCVGAFVSLFALSLIREPPGQAGAPEERATLREYTLRAVPFLRENPRLRRLIVSRILLDGVGIAAPFYVLYARSQLGAPLVMVGLYAAAQSSGKIVTGPLWGWLSDHHGTSSGLRGLALVTLCIPLLALFTSNRALLFYPAVFFLLGAVQDGVWMVSSNALLEVVRPHERPLAVGIASLLQAPGALYSVLGGMLAQRTSYPVAFAAASGLGAAALLATMGLRNPD